MYRVRQVKVLVEKDNTDNLLESISKKTKLNIDDIRSYKIVKKSVDARNKNEIYFVYEVDIETNKNLKLDNDIIITPNLDYVFPHGSGKDKKIVVIGSGPAGLFSGYILAKCGYKPLIIERGEQVEDRIKSVEEFWKNGKLNTNSNISFGEGGAGTFSDGKLNTLIKDTNNRMKFVFETFVEMGASEEILYSYKPHIGTDVLINVVKNIRNKIIELGGEFRFNTCLTDINIEDNKIKSIVVNNNEEIEVDNLVLAIGHSSRDTFKMLYDKMLNMEAKAFAVGYRVIHNQDMINKSQFGEKYKDMLGSSPYKLTYKASNNRGVYSFCMCPGGYVVNASSEENRLCINGMSYSKRDSKWANSAIIVTVYPRDFGINPLDGIKFQRDLEEKAYELGKGNIPVQLLGDFINNKESTCFKTVNPEFKGKYTFSNLNDLLPLELNNSIKESFNSFGNKIKGFDNSDTVLAGIEARTSSPVRIIRNDNFISNIEGIYPCGEGAGYAGGITSAAIDGIKVAEAIINN